MKREPLIIEAVHPIRLKPPRSAGPQVGRPGRTQAQRKSPSILVIDQDRSIRHRLRRALHAAGWEVRCAATAAEGLDLLQEAVPDLLITDLSGGTVSGWDLLFHETLERPELPIFAMSTEALDSVYGVAHFARKCFQKPIDIPAVVAAIRRQLGEPVGDCFMLL